MRASQARAAAVAQIAADVERRHTTVAAELAEIDASLTDRIDAADAVGTPAELAEFTGIPETELFRVSGEPVNRRGHPWLPVATRCCRELVASRGSRR